MRFFWALGALVGLFNALSIRRRGRTLVERDPSLQADVDRMFRVALVALVLPCLPLGAIQAAGGFPTPLFILLEDLRNVYVQASLGVIGLLWLLALWWAWFTDGPEAWARISPSGFDVRAARIWWPAMMLVMGIGFFLARSQFAGAWPS